MGKFTLLGLLAASCLCAIAVITALAMRWDDAPAQRVRFALGPATPATSASAKRLPQADHEPAPAPISIEEVEHLPKVSGSSPPARSAAASGLRLRDIDFDLADSPNGSDSASGSAVSVTKKLVVNGTEAGTASILIGRGSQIFVSSRDLEAARAGASSVAGDAAYLSFDQLRDRGLAIRYDPLRDVIEIGD